jgi:hypothetical protein
MVRCGDTIATQCSFDDPVDVNEVHIVKESKYRERETWDNVGNEDIE